MKIGLYLQDRRNGKCDDVVFESKMKAVKKSGMDLLVFPEDCYTPFSYELKNIDFNEEGGFEYVIEHCIKLSREIECALVYGGIDKNDFLYCVYANAFAKNGETESRIYIKHTATKSSAFDMYPYEEIIDNLFELVVLKNKKIGMTICYDCNHSAFSRVYGKQDIDILINCTGGNVQHRKWHRYNKVRALENNCYSFCTMSYVESVKINSFAFGFTPKGKLIEPSSLYPINKEMDNIGNIFIYDIPVVNDKSEVDIGIDQEETTNRYQDFFINPDEILQIQKEAKQLSDGLFIKKKSDENIVFCIVKNDDILKPEKVLDLMYSNKLKEYSNKRYIIINQWDKISNDIYSNILSDVLKVRSMENFCAVLLVSPQYTKCYQCGKNRSAQVVKLENGKFGIDLSRTGGPEVIWKDKPGMMKASWRKGYEQLIERIR